MCVEELPRGVAPHAFLDAFADEPYLALLDAPPPHGRFAYLALADEVFVARGERAFFGPPTSTHEVDGAPLDVLASILRARKKQADPRSPAPFSSGAIGFFAYEARRWIEPRVPIAHDDDLDTPDALFLFCDGVLAHDARDGRTFLLGEPRRADDLRRLARALPIAPTPPSPPRPRSRLDERALAEAGVRAIDRARYLEAIARAKEHIARGDAYEVCLTHRLESTRPPSGLPLFHALRTVNPAPFAAYLRAADLEVISSSPERFLRLGVDRLVETKPIKGTRPRSIDRALDDARAKELRESDKDRAENVMIVDLARNDLGRVCEVGSVHVPSLFDVESFATVHQLVSTVRGTLRADRDAIDLVRATFPGGSMTGAPKVSAMEIIDALEAHRRGVYSGALGFFSDDGAIDLSIVIRTFVRARDRLVFHVGGAIVADSDPAEEWQETLDKAHALVAALRACG